MRNGAGDGKGEKMLFAWILIFAVALVALGYMILTLPWQGHVAPRSIPLVPAQYMFTPIQFRPRGEPMLIAGAYLSPHRASKAVIIAHDSGARHGHTFAAGMHDLAAHLALCGIAVLMLDLRNCSACHSVQPHRYAQQRHDLLGAVDWLLAQGYAPGRIGAIGVAAGAAAGISALNEEPAIGALIIDRPTIGVPRRAGRQRYLARLLAIVGQLTSAPDAAELQRAIARRPVMIMHTSGARQIATYGLRVPEYRTGWLRSFSADPYAYGRQIHLFLHYALGDRHVFQPGDSAAPSAPCATGICSQMKLL